MSRKKTSKSKAGSAPATSALPAANGPRPVRPGTARPCPEAPPNGPPQPGWSSIGGGGDFYDVAFKVSRAPPAPGDASAAGGVRPELSGEGIRGNGAGPCGASAPSWLPERHPAAGKAGAVHRARARTHTHTAVKPGFGIPNIWQGCPPPPPRSPPGGQGRTRGPAEVRAWQVSSPCSLMLLPLPKAPASSSHMLPSLAHRVF